MSPAFGHESRGSARAAKASAGRMRSVGQVPNLYAHSHVVTAEKCSLMRGLIALELSDLRAASSHE